MVCGGRGRGDAMPVVSGAPDTRWGVAKKPPHPNADKCPKSDPLQIFMGNQQI